MGIILGSVATNSCILFVTFRGGAPGSFLDAFWLPFGRLLDWLLEALGTSLVDFASILAALGRLGSL